MKLLKDTNTEKQKFPRNGGKSVATTAWLLFLPMLMIACGGSLGKIQVENVDAVLTESETAIEQARLANAQFLAPDTLDQAESAIESAREAVKAKDGLEAMRLAYDALTQARIAEQEAMYRSQEEGLNAIIKRKEAEIIEFQANLKAADASLEENRAEMQRLDMETSQLQTKMDRKIREVEWARQQALRDYSTIQTEVHSLQSKLDTTQTQFRQARSQVEAQEHQVYQLRRELALAQSMVEEARKEATEARAKAKTQARSYSKQIERLDQSSKLKQREVLLSQKAQAARAYVQRRRTGTPDRTGKTSLTDQQIVKGKAVINDWYIAWATKEMNQHLRDYTQDVTIEQIVIRASGEQRTNLNRTQMVDALKKMSSQAWVRTDAGIEPDGERVIGVYRFSRLSQRAGNGNHPALYDVWTREIWVTQVGNQWKISHEGWRIYEDVPKYATIFN
ncbi:MAG: DUF4398 domain-containing protein [Candidatus Poribacteria bacterium]|nr:DUF4398 domain-containing protein [Candidatus Poribacteria bacterium]